MAQTVTTDQPDYPPGSTVYISGAGFTPGENVQLQVVNLTNPSDTGDEHQPWTVPTDTNGNFTATWYVTSDELGMTLKLMALGLSSGLKAEEVFTDGNVDGIIAGTQTGTLTYGTVSTATYTISFTSQGNASYSGLNVSGLPSGVTSKLSAPLGSGNPPGDQTLTVTNGASTPAGTYTITIATTSPTLSTTATLTIGKKPATITGVSAAGKTYDGTTTATLSGGTVSGTVNSDNVTFTAGTGAFASKFIGTQAVTASGYALTTSGVSTNYTLSAQPTVANATISAKGVTITNVTASGKTYDSTTTATLNNGSAAVSGAVSPDNVTFTTGTGVFSSQNVGSRAVTASGYALTSSGISTNYTLSAQPTVVNATISARALTVTAGSSTKVYNATTSSTNVPAITSGALQGSDTANFSVTYDTKNAGSGKTLTPAGTVTDGNSGNNYSYIFATSTSGVINKTNLTVTAQANTKTYDGGTSSVTNAVITAGSIQSGDTAPTWTQTYDTKNAGTGKTLTPSSLVVTDGNSGNNYNYTYTTSATGAINGKPLTITASNQSKTYGVALGLGTTAFSVGGSLISSESVTATVLAANGGTNVTDTVGSYIITPGAATGTGGFAAGNYSLTYITGTLTVSQAGTSISVASSLNPSGYKASVNFLASLPSTATGSVIFLTNSTPFSTNSLASGSATSASTILLPRGTNTITVQYIGDVNYVGSTNILSGGQIVTNHPPVVGNVSYTRSVNSMKIFISSLFTNVTDVDGDTITLTALGTSTNGVTLSSNPSLVLYNNANNVNDQFTYTVSDGNGGSATGTVSVVFFPFASGQNGTITPAGGIAKVHYQAIPNYHYSIQRSTNMVDWTTILTTNAAPNGAIDRNDDFSDLGGSAPPSAFYRLVWTP
ncbi:MAG: Ig-like domain repeat protein [Verrucomicrobia bacterium]|nr:Ig-like domain repeat protein [Verrucomicrobiota bacterium]